MKEYEAGRESSLLALMLNGRKTVELRLNRGKFSAFQSGDRIHLREDIYKNGKVTKEIPNRATSEIIKINRYTSFEELFKTEGILTSFPDAQNIPEAINECRKFYSEEEEKQHGVLAIYFRII